jgi:hypothetical protein
VGQRERPVTARRRPRGARVERDYIEIRVGDRERQRATDRTSTGDYDVVHHQVNRREMNAGPSWSHKPQ